MIIPGPNKLCKLRIYKEFNLNIKEVTSDRTAFLQTVNTRMAVARRSHFSVIEIFAYGLFLYYLKDRKGRLIYTTQIYVLRRYICYNFTW